MKNFIKSFNRLQRLNEQSENQGGIPQELVSYIESLIMSHPNVDPGTAGVGVNDDGMLYIFCELYNEGVDPIIMEYEIKVGKDPDSTYYIFIDTKGSPDYPEQDGLEYYIAGNIEEEGLSEDGLIEAIRIALDNATKDWSDEGPEATGGITVELISDPGKKLEFSAYFD